MTDVMVVVERPGVASLVQNACVAAFANRTATELFEECALASLVVARGTPSGSKVQGEVQAVTLRTCCSRRASGIAVVDP